MNIDKLETTAREVREDIVKMYWRAGWGHLTSALSCVDILTALYFGGVLKLNDLKGVDRDRVVLSKGHACAALYAILARCGYFPREELNTFYQKGTRLIGLASCSVPGVDIPTGSLGHGVCFATGTALAAKINGWHSKTYVILGDGESQEGSVWEAALFAASHELNNLIVILDYNQMQGSGWIKEISNLYPVEDKWQAFGWNVLRADGNDLSNLLEVFSQSFKETHKPTIIIAATVKGKGISLVENRPDWHGRAPKGDEWASVCEDINITLEELNKI